MRARSDPSRVRAAGQCEQPRHTRAPRSRGAVGPRPRGRPQVLQPIARVTRHGPLAVRSDRLSVVARGSEERASGRSPRHPIPRRGPPETPPGPKRARIRSRPGREGCPHPRRQDAGPISTAPARASAEQRRRTCGGSSNGKRVAAAVTRYGYRRGVLRGVSASRGDRKARGACFPSPTGRNAANLMTGCGAQQTRGARVEQAVKAGRNREGGTGPGVWQRQAEGSSGSREWTPEASCRWRGGE